MIEDILKTIEKSGYSCYIVGGYVRDKLLGINSNDIDIATSAPPEKIREIFGIESKESYGTILVPNDKYNIEITSYRIESSYENRHPRFISYTDDILKDLSRRDFTINAICMSTDGTFFDPLDGIIDLDKRIIRVIGDVSLKFSEDPLRMLRALRIAATREFIIEESASNFIKNNIGLLNSLSYARKKTELDYIFSSKRVKEGIALLDEYGALKVLELSLDNGFYKKAGYYGTWAQFTHPTEYPFKKSERNIITMIKKIFKIGKIDIFSIFTYGLEANLEAGKIIGYSKREILNIYRSMTLKKEEDLVIDGSKIESITGANGEIIGKIKKDLIKEILSGNLPNRELELEKYIIQKWK